jgi:hypothetical protein
MKPFQTLVLLLGLMPASALAPQALALAPGDKWTATDPSINLVHIDFGEINRHGEAVGYHHRPNGMDPDGARVLQIIQSPDLKGVYRARVSIRDPATGVWVRKHSGQRRSDGQFVGPSGRGFMIEGWFQNGRISAAYPLRGP